MTESYRENLASSSGHKPYAGSSNVPGVAWGSGDAGQPPELRNPCSRVPSPCPDKGKARRLKVCPVTTTSLTCGWRGSCTGRRALVTATGNAAEGIPRGNIRGRDPLAGGTRTGCSITPRTSPVPAGLSSSRDRRQRDAWWCGATIFSEWILPFALSAKPQALPLTRQ